MQETKNSFMASVNAKIPIYRAFFKCPFPENNNGFHVLIYYFLRIYIVNTTQK